MSDAREKAIRDALNRMIRASVAHAALIDSEGPSEPTDVELRHAAIIGREVADAALALGRAIRSSVVTSVPDEITPKVER